MKHRILEIVLKAKLNPYTILRSYSKIHERYFDVTPDCILRIDENLSKVFISGETIADCQWIEISNDEKILVPESLKL